MVAPASGDGVGPGTVLGATYRIERLVGRGGMGIVWEAQHLRVPRRVAVKVLTTAPDPEQLARFRQEAETAARIGHPNIVDVLDFDVLPSGLPYLVMELLDGESLAARLRGGPLPLADALAILRQIASALFAAHGARVVHRDLKPENVFLSRREQGGELVDHATVLDFGISKVEDTALVRTGEDVVLGTPQYMAPEQAEGHNDRIDARTDQFALGAIAYEMLAGRRAFDGPNATQVMYRIVHEPAEDLAALAPDVPPHVIDAIARAMAKDPARRFEDLSRFVEALTGKPLAAASGERWERGTLEAARPTKSERPPARIVSRRRWIVALGAVAAIAAAGLAWRATRARSTAPPIDAPAADAAANVADAAVDAPSLDAPAPDAPAPSVPVHAAPPPPPERVSPEVAAELATAEAALAAGDLDRADAVARHTLYGGGTVRAHALLAEIACARRDRVTARSWMRRVPASAWPGIRARCAKRGFPIDDP